jgi:macrodomain Ter protein organizer (MatP/YcbG family)
MGANRITTDTFLQRLKRTTSIERFIRRHDKDMDRTPLLHEHLTFLCAQRNITPESVIKASDIERTYGHKFFNGARQPTRDKVIQLAFGFGMNFTETQELLAIAKKSALHPKVKRDAVITYALEKKHNLMSVQETLHELEIPLLGELK